MDLVPGQHVWFKLLATRDGDHTWVQAIITRASKETEAWYLRYTETGNETIIPFSRNRFRTEEEHAKWLLMQ